jgi:hypothetical protein
LLTIEGILGSGKTKEEKKLEDQLLENYEDTMSVISKDLKSLEDKQKEENEYLL